MNVTSSTSPRTSPPRPLDDFVDRLPSGASVWLASRSEPELEGKLRRFGHTVVRAEDRDLRLVTLPAERFDAVWWSEASENFTLEDAQRILGIFFKGLRPRTGWIAVSFRHAPAGAHSWGRTEFEALFRQSGFSLTDRYEKENVTLIFGRRA